MIPAISGRVPANIAVRLREVAVTRAVRNTFCSTITDAVLTLPVGSNNRSPVPGQGKVLRSNEPLRDGLVKELALI